MSRKRKKRYENWANRPLFCLMQLFPPSTQQALTQRQKHILILIWSIWWASIDWKCGITLPPRWSSVTGQSGFVYTISLRVGITSTRPARMLSHLPLLLSSPPPCSVSLLLLPLLLLLLLLLLSPAQTRGGREGAVWHLRGRTGWVTYQLWCQAHMAGTSLARAITWEPVIDMRPHSQRLASPWGRGTRHLSLSWKRKWNKEWMAQKKPNALDSSGFC